MMLSTKIFIFIACSVTFLVSAQQVIGGVRPLSGERLKQAEKELQTSLTKLAAGDGPIYKISKVHSATTQVVSGTLTNFNVDLLDNENALKKCKVSIWSRPWLPNGIEVTFECDGDEKLVKYHSAKN